MEIDAPVHPLSSWRDVLLHLGIVTIGILIALGLESVVEWRRHVAIATEARDNILNEIRDNRRELQDVLKTTPKVIANQRQIIQLADDLLITHRSTIRNVTVGFQRADLSGSSWATAQSVGAISFMPYQEVKSYANIYELQNEYVRLEERTLDASIAAMASFEQKDPFKLPDPELRSMKDKVLTGMADVNAQTQIGEELLKRYSRILNTAH